MSPIDQILAKLAQAVQRGQYEEFETDVLEIKSVPADGAQWHELHKSVNAFLNARGGIVILGVKDVRDGDRRYVFTGWQAHAEEKLKQLPKLFTDRQRRPLDLSDCFPPMQLRPFLDGQVGIVFVDELAADRKYVFYRDHAYERILTGDHKIPDAKIEAQEEYKEEALQARELQPVTGAGIDDVDLDKLNEYIHHLNRPVKVETIKADLTAAMPFLERKVFLKDGVMTTLGMLVCGRHPTDHLGFRCQVHGYVDIPQQVAQDKQDFADNILPLMENSLAYILRNIQVGVSAAGGGSSVPQYPESLLRETVNNALAHRDYSINKQAIIAIKPNAHVSIRNPGAFRKHLLIESPAAPAPVRRIIPEAKPRNPKLADVLRVYRKWEGRGIGMATLVNLCLQNQIDLPYYRFYSEEVCLFVCAGKLLDDRMEQLFQSFNGYLDQKLSGNSLTEAQRLVLAYLIKSEWANQELRYTILLTPDNNHFNELASLEKDGLIIQHAGSTPLYPVYVADRTLVTANYLMQLRALFGAGFDDLPALFKDVLNVVYRFNHYSKARTVSAKQTAFALWFLKSAAPGDIKEFDAFYRQVRYAFNRLLKAGFVEKPEGTRGYLLRTDYRERHPLLDV